MLPPGVSLGQYMRFTAAALFAMFLGEQFNFHRALTSFVLIVGSQTVHGYYRPLSDMEKFINEELKKLPMEEQQKVHIELHHNSS